MNVFYKGLLCTSMYALCVNVHKIYICICNMHIYAHIYINRYIIVLCMQVCM